MRTGDYVRFERTVMELEEKARACGLDFFPMRYEICPADVVYTIAGFGMPTRFSHWSFGKHYYRQKLDFDFGLSRIYELVVNTDPCYAFFLENNTILQNEMIIAHVLGHSDFFKNNGRFQNTNRNMVETMATTSRRFREYEEKYGIDQIEEVIDAAMAIAEHIDPSIQAFESNKDVMRFILDNNSNLEAWEKDIIGSIREEMLYFWPQIETKIMNEGWATFWHNTLMEERDLEEEDAIEFSRLTAQVAAPNQFRLNPYNVGLAIWKDIKNRFGMEEMFIIRECDSDVSFLRNYLTQEIVDACDLYLYEKRGEEWVIAERDYRVIRRRLIAQRINGGFSVLHVSNEKENGRLVLKHAFEGIELDAEYIKKTLPHVYRLWGNVVSLQTKMDEREIEFTYDGKKIETKRL
jgi:stage V sporulation protein R